jgi:flagellar biosynthesis/type III secretory pathway protein FliH
MTDLFTPAARDAPQGAFTPTFLIAALDAARREAAAAAALPPPPPGPDPVEALLTEARAAGREEGRAAALAEAARSQAARAAEAVAQAAAALADGRDAAAEAAEAAAAAMSRAVLAVLDAALPGLAATHGAPLAAAFARRLAPMLDAAPEARILVPAGLGEEVRALLADAEITVAEDAALPPGDARAEWRAGGAAFDLAARRREIRQVLLAAGLGEEE